MSRAPAHCPRGSHCRATPARGSGLHDATVSEHAIALILSLVLRLTASTQAPREHRWANELGGVQPLRPEGAVTSLICAKVLIWGFRNIGRRVAGMLTLIGADVRGIARTGGEREGFTVVAEEDLGDELARADIPVMVLPATPETERALDAPRLAALPDHAYVVSVGRSTTVDEAALLDALREGRLAGAAIDVTTVDALPSESPLWDAPRLLITPHAAGGRPVGASELIAENLSALTEGRPLLNVIA